MKEQEFEFKGLSINGFLMLFVVLALVIGGGLLSLYGVFFDDELWVVPGGLMVLIGLVLCAGFVLVEPNIALVMMFFGKYHGTYRSTGFHWVNPFITTKKLSLRANNLDAEPIKVNDKTGNPVMIGQVLVWKLSDTYKATFEIDAQQATEVNGLGGQGKALMLFYQRFVKIQSDAALRKVAGEFAYDANDASEGELTLRGGGDKVNEILEQELRERLSMAGIEVVEARINYLAYAPEIAAVMLRRQQADAIISAREKIVEGAVSMVKLALTKLGDEGIVELDDDKKAAMASNLMVVLCADDSAQPVVNTGTLNM